MSDPSISGAKNVPPLQTSAKTGCPAPDRQEWKWVAVFAVVVLLFTLLPYLIGYAVQGVDWQFTGFMIGVEDGNSYIAKMLSGAAGAWLFRTPYTAYPQRGVLTFVSYILLGKLAAPPGVHDQLVALYQFYRIVSGFLAILATYDFIAYFIKKVSLRKLGLVLAVLGGGLGWLILLIGNDSWLGSMPLEFYSPESFGFLGLFGLPHLAIGRAFMLWGLLGYLRAAEQDLEMKAAFITGLKVGVLWLVSGLFQPLVGMSLGVLAGIYLVGILCWQFWLRVYKGWRMQWDELQKRLLLAIGAGLIALPWVAYNFISLYQDPFLKQWAAQNILTSPHPFHYLSAYGLILFPAIVGGRYLLGSRPWGGILPVTWAIALPALAYAPISIQRRLPDGIWIALVVLAIAGLGQFESKMQGRSLRRWLRLPLLLAFPSTIILLFGAFIAVGQPGLPVFRPSGQIDAFMKLADAAETGQVVLAAYETGNALPAWAPVRVLIGLGPESINLSELKPRIAQFYQANTSDANRQSLLDEFKVSFVFWGPAERALGSWDPHQAPYLDPVYEFEDYAIFSVQ